MNKRASVRGTEGQHHFTAVREIVSGGSSTVQFVDEARARASAEREKLEGLQGGVKVVIPASESLAMKADLILPWHKLRIVRR